jgi:hypothetical protein
MVYCFGLTLRSLSRALSSDRLSVRVSLFLEVMLSMSFLQAIVSLICPDVSMILLNPSNAGVTTLFKGMGPGFSFLLNTVNERIIDKNISPVINPKKIPGDFSALR